MAKGRQVANFVEGYHELLKDIPGPPHFKDWVALWMLSAAMERRTWTITQSSPCYANLYVLLISPSGGGKGESLKAAGAMVASLGSSRLSASSMTCAYLQQALSENERPFINPVNKNAEPFHALNILSPEMMVLFPILDNELFGNLTDLWDCRGFSVGRITTERNAWLERTCVTGLFATTPQHIHSLISKDAWHGGFMSRMIMVVGESVQRVTAFAHRNGSEQITPDGALYKRLNATLKHVAELQGEFGWTDEAAAAFDRFYAHPGNMGGPPVPLHPNLTTYCGRRHQQLEKIMMCYHAGRSDDMTLDIEDFNYAHTLLLNAEALMPDIFTGANADSPHGQANGILYALYRWQLENKTKFISGPKIFQEINKKIRFFNEAQHVFTLLKNSTALRKVPELQLSEKQRAKSSEWFQIINGSLDEEIGSIDE